MITMKKDQIIKKGEKGIPADTARDTAGREVPVLEYRPRQVSKTDPIGFLASGSAAFSIVGFVSTFLLYDRILVAVSIGVALLTVGLSVWARRRSRARVLSDSRPLVSLLIGISLCVCWGFLFGLVPLSGWVNNDHGERACMIWMQSIGGCLTLYAQAHGGQYPERLDSILIEGTPEFRTGLNCRATGKPYSYYGRGLREP